MNGLFYKHGYQVRTIFRLLFVLNPRCVQNILPAFNWNSTTNFEQILYLYISISSTQTEVKYSNIQHELSIKSMANLYDNDENKKKVY